MKLRQSNIKKLQEKTLDVLIVGGGINGAVCASVLATKGASVGLIDKGDFASFTSQESSNLVWGGIKYLESLDFELVWKLCQSRNQLLQNYPSQVKEVRFFVNLHKKFRYHRWFLYLGSWLYWLMGRLYTKPPRLLSVRDIQQEEPHINVGESQGGFEYSDAYLIENDARFVFNFIRNTINHGGVPANYVEALEAQRNPDGLWEVRVRDTLTQQEWIIRTHVLLNACGPHADTFNQRCQIETKHHHLFSKGVHLIVKRLTSSARVLTFFASDGRLFFVIPMGSRSCIGTTDTRVDQIPPKITEDDRDFILENINRLLRLEQPLTRADILAERCGVRPLATEPLDTNQDDGDWTSLSRKHAIEMHKERKHITIFGGKLTDCLNVGEEVCALVKKLGISLPSPDMRWYGEPPEEVRHAFFHQAHEIQLDRMGSADLPEPLSQRLWRRYGEYALSLLEDIRQDPRMADVVLQEVGYLRCELYHVAHTEMITRLEDFLRRRSQIAQTMSHEAIAQSSGLKEACSIFFGDEAEARYHEYFAERQLS